MKKTIRSSLALVCAGLVAAGSPLNAQPQPESAETASSPNDRSADDSDAASGDFYCGDRKLGTWFYCEKPKQRPHEKRSEENTSELQSLMHTTYAVIFLKEQR